MMSITRKIILLLCILILVLLLGLVLFEKFTLNTSPALIKEVATNRVFEPITNYKDINLEAKSALVYDLSDKRSLFELNPYAVRPLASITKIATAIVGRTLLPKTAPILILDEYRTSEKDFNLKSNEIWPMRDLIQYFLVNSSNDGAQELCAYVDKIIKEKNNQNGDCVGLINHYVRNQGLNSMHFVNPTGLDNQDNSASNYGSAYDTARLMALAYFSYPNLFSVTAKPQVSFQTQNYTYTAINTDKILDKIPGLLIGKTGYTETAGGNLAIIYSPRPDKKITIVILGSSQEGRFSDMLTLVNRTNQYLETH